jgi:hypothetical protein
MKKQFYLLLFLLLFSAPMIAQTVVWEESFDSAPAGWTLEGNWIFTAGQLLMNFYPVALEYDFSAISSDIAIPDNAGELTVSQFLEVYPFSVTTEQCEISVISDSSEVVLWSYSLFNGNWGIIGGEDISFSLVQYSGQTIKIKFRSWGPTTDAWYGWYIYDLKISSLFNNDLSAMAVEGPINVGINQTGLWTVGVRNYGLMPQSDFKVKLFTLRTGDEIGDITVQDVVQPGETKPITFQWTPDAVQNTCLFGIVISEDDEFLSNNTTSSHFVRIEPDMDYNILVWDNDNGIQTVTNPETGVLEQPNVGLTSALEDAGINYTLTTVLPFYLEGWDIIIATMGCYCLS